MEDSDDDSALKSITREKSHDDIAECLPLGSHVDVGASLPEKFRDVNDVGTKVDNKFDTDLNSDEDVILPLQEDEKALLNAEKFSKHSNNSQESAKECRDDKEILEDCEMLLDGGALNVTPFGNKKDSAQSLQDDCLAVNSFEVTERDENHDGIETSDESTVACKPLTPKHVSNKTTKDGKPESSKDSSFANGSLSNESPCEVFSSNAASICSTHNAKVIENCPKNEQINDVVVDASTSSSIKKESSKDSLIIDPLVTKNTCVDVRFQNSSNNGKSSEKTSLNSVNSLGIDQALCSSKELNSNSNTLFAEQLHDETISLISSGNAESKESLVSSNKINIGQSMSSNQQESSLEDFNMATLCKNVGLEMPKPIKKSLPADESLEEPSKKLCLVPDDSNIENFKSTNSTKYSDKQIDAPQTSINAPIFHSETENLTSLEVVNNTQERNEKDDSFFKSTNDLNKSGHFVEGASDEITSNDYCDENTERTCDEEGVKVSQMEDDLEDLSKFIEDEHIQSEDFSYLGTEQDQNTDSNQCASDDMPPKIFDEKSDTEKQEPYYQEETAPNDAPHDVETLSTVSDDENGCIIEENLCSSIQAMDFELQLDDHSLLKEKVVEGNIADEETKSRDFTSSPSQDIDEHTSNLDEDPLILDKDSEQDEFEDLLSSEEVDSIDSFCIDDQEDSTPSKKILRKDANHARRKIKKKLSVTIINDNDLLLIEDIFSMKSKTIKPIEKEEQRVSRKSKGSDKTEGVNHEKDILQQPKPCSVQIEAERSPSHSNHIDTEAEQIKAKPIVLLQKEDHFPNKIKKHDKNNAEVSTSSEVSIKPKPKSKKVNYLNEALEDAFQEFENFFSSSPKKNSHETYEDNSTSKISQNKLNVALPPVKRKKGRKKTEVKNPTSSHILSTPNPKMKDLKVVLDRNVINPDLKKQGNVYLDHAEASDFQETPLDAENSKDLDISPKKSEVHKEPLDSLPQESQNFQELDNIDSDVIQTPQQIIKPCEQPSLNNSASSSGHKISTHDKISKELDKVPTFPITSNRHKSEINTSKNVSLNSCCGHWFPSRNKYINHLIANSTGKLDIIHQSKLIEMNMTKCTHCEVWKTSNLLKKHLKSQHGIMPSKAASASLSIKITTCQSGPSGDFSTDENTSTPNSDFEGEDGERALSIPNDVDTPEVLGKTMKKSGRIDKPCPKSKKRSFNIKKASINNEISHELTSLDKSDEEMLNLQLDEALANTAAMKKLKAKSKFKKISNRKRKLDPQSINPDFEKESREKILSPEKNLEKSKIEGRKTALKPRKLKPSLKSKNDTGHDNNSEVSSKPKKNIRNSKSYSSILKNSIIESKDDIQLDKNRRTGIKLNKPGPKSSKPCPKSKKLRLTKSIKCFLDNDPLSSLNELTLKSFSELPTHLKPSVSLYSNPHITPDLTFVNCKENRFMDILHKNFATNTFGKSINLDDSSRESADDWITNLNIDDSDFLPDDIYNGISEALSGSLKGPNHLHRKKLKKSKDKSSPTRRPLPLHEKNNNIKVNSSNNILFSSKKKKSEYLKLSRSKKRSKYYADDSYMPILMPNSKNKRGRFRSSFIPREVSETSDGEPSICSEDERHESSDTDSSIKENIERIPTVELDLYTLPAYDEEVSLFLRDSQNPDLKLFASMNAIFVGDSAATPLHSHASYMIDSENVIFVNPSHFLFPKVEESFDLSSILKVAADSPVKLADNAIGQKLPSNIRKKVRSISFEKENLESFDNATILKSSIEDVKNSNRRENGESNHKSTETQNSQKKVIKSKEKIMAYKIKTKSPIEKMRINIQDDGDDAGYPNTTTSSQEINISHLSAEEDINVMLAQSETNSQFHKHKKICIMGEQKKQITSTGSKNKIVTPKIGKDKDKKIAAMISEDSENIPDNILKDKRFKKMGSSQMSSRKVPNKFAKKSSIAKENSGEITSSREDMEPPRLNDQPIVIRYYSGASRKAETPYENPVKTIKITTKDLNKVDKSFRPKLEILKDGNQPIDPTPKSRLLKMPKSLTNPLTGKKSPAISKEPIVKPLTIAKDIEEGNAQSILKVSNNDLIPDSDKAALEVLNGINLDDPLESLLKSVNDEPFDILDDFGSQDIKSTNHSRLTDEGIILNSENTEVPCIKKGVESIAAENYSVPDAHCSKKEELNSSLNVSKQGIRTPSHINSNEDSANVVVALKEILPFEKLDGGFCLEDLIEENSFNLSSSPRNKVPSSPHKSNLPLVMSEIARPVANKSENTVIPEENKVKSPDKRFSGKLAKYPKEASDHLKKGKRIKWHRGKRLPSDSDSSSNSSSATLSESDVDVEDETNSFDMTASQGSSNILSSEILSSLLKGKNLWDTPLLLSPCKSPHLKLQFEDNHNQSDELAKMDLSSIKHLSPPNKHILAKASHLISPKRKSPLTKLSMQTPPSSTVRRKSPKNRTSTPNNRTISNKSFDKLSLSPLKKSPKKRRSNQFSPKEKESSNKKEDELKMPDKKGKDEAVQKYSPDQLNKSSLETDHSKTRISPFKNADNVPEKVSSVDNRSSNANSERDLSPTNLSDLSSANISEAQSPLKMKISLKNANSPTILSSAASNCENNNRSPSHQSKANNSTPSDVVENTDYDSDSSSTSSSSSDSNKASSCLGSQSPMHSKSSHTPQANVQKLNKSEEDSDKVTQSSVHLKAFKEMLSSDSLYRGSSTPESNMKVGVKDEFAANSPSSANKSPFSGLKIKPLNLLTDEDHPQTQQSQNKHPEIPKSSPIKNRNKIYNRSTPVRNKRNFSSNNKDIRSFFTQKNSSPVLSPDNSASLTHSKLSALDELFNDSDDLPGFEGFASSSKVSKKQPIIYPSDRPKKKQVRDKSMDIRHFLSPENKRKSEAQNLPPAKRQCKSYSVAELRKIHEDRFNLSNSSFDPLPSIANFEGFDFGGFNSNAAKIGLKSRALSRISYLFKMIHNTKQVKEFPRDLLYNWDEDLMNNRIFEKDLF